ncbi:MAG: hypothetical protein ABS948_15325 [Solibacillus sp.]
MQKKFLLILGIIMLFTSACSSAKGKSITDVMEENLIEAEATSDYQKAQKIEMIEGELTQMGFKAKSHGLVGDGIVDDAPALQALINSVRAKVIASNFKVDNVVEIPAGRYKLNSQIIMSPFLKLKAVGRVIFETYIPNNSALWVTPQADDPDFLTIMNKQQWLRSPIINGVDGGFIFVNKLNKNKSNSTAIEFGSRTDLGSLRPLSRYAVTDVAVQHYNIGFKMNRFRHYIASYHRIHLELNNTGVVFGDPNTKVTDSGENFHFVDSLFAGGNTAFRWYSDGFDTHFVNSSFDFLDTVFHMSRGFKIITVNGGHIEGISERILLEDSVHKDDVDRPVTVMFRGVSAYITKRMHFVGSDKIHLTLDGFEYRQMDSDTSVQSAFLIDDRITLKKANLTIQQRGIFPHKKLNKITDPYFLRATVGEVTAASPLPGYYILSEGTKNEIVATEGIEGGKALRVTGSRDTAYSLIGTNEELKATGGDYIIANYALKSANIANVNLSIRYRFFRQDNTELSLVEKNPRMLGSLGEKVGDWFYPDYYTTVVAPHGTAYYKVEFIVASSGINGTPVFVSGLYTTVLN